MKRTVMGLAALAVLGAVLAAGCGAARGGAQLGPGERPLAWAWDCGPGPALVTDFREPDGVWLFAPDFSGRLEQTRAASGIRYEGAGRLFWAKGDQAVYQAGGREYQCRTDVGRSWFEDAKLRGADLRAVGNEPGWALEIGPERLFLITDYGATRLEFPASPPEVSQAGRIAVWRAAVNGHTLEARIEGRPCRDSMSGEHFESTARLVLDGTVLPGCARPLH